MMTRPVLGGLFSYWDADNEALISAIIIDDSFSMSGKNDDLDRHDLLLSTFDSILKNISDNSHIYIATLSKGKLYDGIKSKMPELDKLFHITYTSPEIGTTIQEMKSELSNQNAIKELYYIYTKIHTALKNKNAESIIDMFDEKNNETDIAMNKKPGSTKVNLLSGLKDASEDENNIIVPFSYNEYFFEIEDNLKLIYIDAIAWNIKSGGSRKFSMKFRRENGKWILTR